MAHSFQHKPLRCHVQTQALNTDGGRAYLRAGPLSGEATHTEIKPIVFHNHKGEMVFN